MTRPWLLGVLLLAACGRFEFSEQIAEKRTVELVYPASAAYHAVISFTELTIEPALDPALEKLTISPTLPDGLSLDETTGKISGKPTEKVDRKTYTVTATGEGIIATAELTFTVLPGMVVTSPLDLEDANQGEDQICLAENGLCTLRAAVATANNNPDDRHLILLGPGEHLLTHDLKNIKADLAIVGAGVGATVIRPEVPHSGDRMLDLDSNAKVRLEKMTVQQFGPINGGVAWVKAGLLEAYDVELKDNASPGVGGVLDIFGGAEARFENVSFVDNVVAEGAPPENQGWGGVINAAGVNTKVTVERSTASGNKARWGAFAHVYEGAVLSISNSTLHHNTSRIAGTLATPSGTFELTNVTLAYNTNTNPERRSAGIYIDTQPGGYKMVNSIVAFNTDLTGAQHNCQNNGLVEHLDSLGGNLFSDLAGNCASSFTQEGDGLDLDPLFAQQNAADNGGMTQTMAIEAGSAAIDRGVGDHCPKLDQRGLARKLSALGTCDAGAFELQQ
jgi:Putative Ig domain